MNHEQRAQRHRLEIAPEVQRIIAALPEGLRGSVDLRDIMCTWEFGALNRPLSRWYSVVKRLIVYNGQFIQYKLIGGELEDQFEFARTNASKIAEFLLSGRGATVRKSRILGRTCFCVTLSDGTEWRMERFSAD